MDKRKFHVFTFPPGEAENTDSYTYAGEFDLLVNVEQEQKMKEQREKTLVHTRSMVTTVLSAIIGILVLVCLLCIVGVIALIWAVAASGGFVDGYSTNMWSLLAILVITIVMVCILIKKLGKLYILIDKETDRDFLINYFSSLVALCALIISGISLLVSVINMAK